MGCKLVSLELNLSGEDGGCATPQRNASTLDIKRWFIAVEAHIYTVFGGMYLPMDKYTLIYHRVVRSAMAKCLAWLDTYFVFASVEQRMLLARRPRHRHVLGRDANVIHPAVRLIAHHVPRRKDLSKNLPRPATLV